MTMPARGACTTSSPSARSAPARARCCRQLAHGQDGQVGRRLPPGGRARTAGTPELHLGQLDRVPRLLALALGDDAGRRLGVDPRLRQHCLGAGQGAVELRVAGLGLEPTDGGVGPHRHQLRLLLHLQLLELAPLEVHDHQPRDDGASLRISAIVKLDRVPEPRGAVMAADSTASRRHSSRSSSRKVRRETRTVAGAKPLGGAGSRLPQAVVVPRRPKRTRASLQQPEPRTLSPSRS
jgi:hypothetical protein